MERDGLLIRLRELLARQTQAAAEQALRDGGQVSAAEVERLAALAQLADLTKGAPRRRWPPAVALAVTLGLVSLLLFAHLSDTEIELDAVVSEASFSLTQGQPFSETVALSALGASGLRTVQWPRGLVPGEGRDAATPRPIAALRLTAAASAASAAETGSITLSAMQLPALAAVTVRAQGRGAELGLVIGPPVPALAASLFGAVRVDAAGLPATPIQSAVPATVELSPAAGEVELDLSPAQAGAPILVLPLAVRQLALDRIDERGVGDATRVRRASTVVSATVHLTALNGESRVVRRGERLRFDAAEGTLDVLELDGARLALAFHGRVRGMVAGSDDHPRDLMPTWLEWLRARHGLTLLWGSALYLFGLLMAAWRWWGSKA
jgi:hypothetical protein